MFDYTVSTKKSFQQALADLKDALVSIKFGVLWELDVPTKLQEKGADFQQPFQILEVCNPHHAKEALETNLKVGYFLPCKIVVYEKDTLTYIGMVRPSQMVGILDDALLHDFATNVERELINAIEKAI